MLAPRMRSQRRGGAWRAVGLLGLSLAGLGGCGGEVRETPPPLCTLSRENETEQARRRDPDNEELVRLMLGSGARLEGRAPESECSGQPTSAHRSECDAEAATLPTVELTDASIVTRRVTDERQLVWIMTRSDGVEAEGPIALVERRERGLVVKAQGVVRADRGRPRFRLVSNDRILVVESERCRDENDPATCERTAQILVRNGNRFEREPVRHRETGRCLTPPSVALSRTTTSTLENGWERTFLLSASWEEGSGGLVVHETVSVRDRDPRAPAVPPRPFREVSSDRTLTLGSGLTGEDVPLLQRTLVDLASVAVPPEGDDR
jgi:hypothetical protein